MSEHRGRVVLVKDERRLIDCEACGFVHVDPLPRDADLEAFYRNKFYQTEKARYIEEATIDGDWLELTFADRFVLFEKLVGTGSVLDVGSGPGYFLRAGKQRGWRVVGIEPSPIAAGFAREQHGVTVLDGMFDEGKLPDVGLLDVVHMSEVLEHVRDPFEIIGLAKRCLRPGGLVCISVPNDFNPLQAAVHHGRDDDSPWWVVPDHHLNYFSFESLEAFLDRLGFKVVDRTTTFPMELFQLMGFEYVGNPEVGRSVHGHRKRFDGGLEDAGAGETRRGFYHALAAAGLGRVAVVTAQKNAEERS